MAVVYWIYNLSLTLILLLSLPFVPFFLLLGEGRWKAISERLGFYPRPLAEALSCVRPIWIHAVSAGEVLAAGRLAQHIKKRFPEKKILLSTFTLTGRLIARGMTEGVDGIVYLPIDHPWVVRRALKIFDPSLLIFLETEIWPNILASAYRRGIPTLLLSGRLSPRAFRRYYLFRRFFSPVIRQLSSLGMQNDDSAQRMIRLGVDPGRILITGNIKQAPWEGDGKQEGDLTGSPFIARGTRQVLVVGSTHRGEEEILLDVFLTLKSSFPELQMVLAPRHPRRFQEVERLLQKMNLNYEKKSLKDGGEDWGSDVLFLDTLGDLPAMYAVADVAFVGGSLVDAGGHNLMEPARWRKPVLFGPHMTNFTDIAEEMKKRGGGIEVTEQGDLVRELSILLSDRDRAVKIGEIAWDVVQGDRGVLDRSMGLISRYVE